MLTKRGFLLTGTAIVGGAAGMSLFGFGNAATTTDGKTFPVTHTEAEWRKLLTPDQFGVLRDHGTERAGSSPLDREKRAGLFHCAGCDQAAYSSETKFDSGTGWPSFYKEIDGAIGTSVDKKFFMTRTECHCSRCGGHLGHIFDDGPPPTGLRHCLNGVALKFVPGATQPKSS